MILSFQAWLCFLHCLYVCFGLQGKFVILSFQALVCSSVVLCMPWLARQVHHLGGGNDADPGGTKGQHSICHDPASRGEAHGQGAARKGEWRCHILAVVVVAIAVDVVKVVVEVVVVVVIIVVIVIVAAVVVVVLVVLLVSTTTILLQQYY